MEQKLDYEHRLTAVEDRSKSNTKRLDEMERRQDSLETLATSVAVLASREEQVEKDVKEIKSDVKTLAEKPAKRWEAVVACVITGIITGLIGFVFAKMGIGG